MARVAFVLVPGVHLLDLSGAAQVFSTAATLGADYELEFVGDSATVLSAQGLPLGAATDWPQLTSNDLVLVPGWRAPRLAGSGPISPALLARLPAHHGCGGLVASVCAGADALGRAGLLDGRRCTTHHDLQDELAERYPAAQVVRDVLFTEDDGVVTSAGIASGIDLALHLVAVRHGPALAAQVARTLVVFARRNGDAPQESVMLRHRDHLSDLSHRVQDLIDAQFADRLPLADLARRLAVSPRTLTRAFTAATGLTPMRYQQAIRLERAEHLNANGATLEAAAAAVGFEDARALRRLRVAAAPPD